MDKSTSVLSSQNKSFSDFVLFDYLVFESKSPFHGGFFAH